MARTRSERLYPKGRLRMLRPSHPIGNKLYPIVLEYTWSNRVKRLSLNVKAKYSDWNEKEQSLRCSYGREYARLNNYMQQKMEDTNQKLRQYSLEHPRSMNLAVIDSILHDDPSTRKDKGWDFKEFILSRINMEYNLHHIGLSVMKNATNAMNLFQRFIAETRIGTYNNNSIYLGDINDDIIQSYIDWRLSVRHNSEETINHALTPIIKGLEYASDQGLIPRATYSKIKDMRFRIISKIDTDKNDSGERFLSIEQLHSLIDYKNKCNLKRRKEHLEMFLFSINACGLRLSDIATLRWADIDFDMKRVSKKIIKTRATSSQYLTIPLSDNAISLLEQWHNKRPSSRFVFDLIKEDINLDDEILLKKAIASADKCINQSLKVIGKELELPFNLTFHCSRHTFAIMALNNKDKDKRLSIEVISKLMGHSSSTITAKIYSKYLPSTLQEEYNKFSSSFCF